MQQQEVRRLEVGADRLGTWLAGFATRHGEVSVVAGPKSVLVTAADGATADVLVPYAPLQVDESLPFAGLLEHAARDRRLGVLLVRRGGYAAGVFVGSTLTASKVGKRHVQGRSAAGGWSQQRFARRREGQAREAAGAAAEASVKVLLPEASALEALVTGGDAAMLSAVLEDRRLAVLRPLVAERVLPVPDPRRTVLEAAGTALRSVSIVLTQDVVTPGAGTPPQAD